MIKKTLIFLMAFIIIATTPHTIADDDNPQPDDLLKKFCGMGCVDDLCHSKEWKHSNGEKINWVDETTSDWKKGSDLFHNKMDELFNQKIAQLIGQESTLGRIGQSLATNTAGIKCQSPENDKSDDYQSTYMKDAYDYENEDFTNLVLEETKRFQCALYAQFKSDETVTLLTDRNQGINQYLNRKYLISQEIEVTGRAVIISLDALAEMQIAYIIHKKLECVIYHLDTLRKSLNKNVGQMIRIPAKFINSSFECR